MINNSRQFETNCHFHQSVLFSDEVDILEYGIRILYPIIALITIAVALGYFYFGISNPQVIQGKVRKDPDAVKVEKTSEEREKVQFNKLFVYL